MSGDITQLLNAEVKKILIRVERRIEMMQKQWQGRDPATLAQRQGTPMPSEVIEAWTDVLWMASNPKLPQEAKQAILDFAKAKVFPRLGLYAKEMVPVDDFLRPYMEEWEHEVLDVRIRPEDRAAVLTTPAPALPAGTPALLPAGGKGTPADTPISLPTGQIVSHQTPPASEPVGDDEMDDEDDFMEPVDPE